MLSAAQFCWYWEFDMCLVVMNYVQLCWLAWWKFFFSNTSVVKVAGYNSSTQLAGDSQNMRRVLYPYILYILCLFVPTTSHPLPSLSTTPPPLLSQPPEPRCTWQKGWPRRELMPCLLWRPVSMVAGWTAKHLFTITLRSDHLNEITWLIETRWDASKEKYILDLIS